MIYLSKQNLLFLKPRKVAGTSVEIALSASADSNDIVTPMTARGFATERQRCELGGHFPVNWAWRSSFELDYRKRYDHFLRTGETLRRFGRGGDKTFSRIIDCRYFNHISPPQLQWRAPIGFLARTRIITIVRNPYEFVVSLASHLSADSGGDLCSEIDKVLKLGPLNQEFYFSHNKPHFVIRYERLIEDLTLLETEFSLSIVEGMAAVNNTQRIDRRNAREILTAKQVLHVRQVYASIFQSFDYAL